MISLAAAALAFPWPALASPPQQGLQLPHEVSAAPRGSWGTPRQHDLTVAPGFVHDPPVQGIGRSFNAVHLALIPPPSVNAGLVLSLDRQDQADRSGWSQRWTVLDPSTDPPTVLWNDELLISGLGTGNLFCAGHAWTPDGRLFVAGGTSFFGHVFGGAKLALMFDPAPAPGAPYGTWTFLPPMAIDRWYPTVTLLGNDRLMVSGGSHLTGNQNSYEVYDPVAGTWEVDATSGDPWFGGVPNGTLVGYPRMHVVSDGFVFWSGPLRQAGRVDHAQDPGVWTLTDISMLPRHDGSSVLLPREYGAQEEIMILGGGGHGHEQITNATEICRPQEELAEWSPGPPLNRRRLHMNVVLLPDKSTLAIGGNDFSEDGVRIPWKDAEWRKDGPWRLLAAGASVRDYHSSAVLLPDGKVLSAGGDNRDWDWQLFSPPYFDVPGPRPTNVTAASPVWNYQADGGGPYQVRFDPLPSGTRVARAVLIPPGSMTHHSDMSMRFVSLPIQLSGLGSLSVLPPFNSCEAPNPASSCAPRGYYMLFLVTEAGIPSCATFIRLE